MVGHELGLPKEAAELVSLHDDDDDGGDDDNDDGDDGDDDGDDG